MFQPNEVVRTPGSPLSTIPSGSRSHFLTIEAMFLPSFLFDILNDVRVMSLPCYSSTCISDYSGCSKMVELFTSITTTPHIVQRNDFFDT